LQIAHIQAGLYSPACTPLQRIAFAVVSEWWHIILIFAYLSSHVGKLRAAMIALQAETKSVA
jgi:hypothetical protein